MATLMLGLGIGAAPFCANATGAQPIDFDSGTVHENCVDDCAALDATEVQAAAITLPSRDDPPCPALSTYTLMAQPATTKAVVVAFSSSDHIPLHPNLRFCVWQL